MRFLAAVTGFGAFEKVTDNPSGSLALRLAERGPEGWSVSSSELPVSFLRAPLAFDELLNGLDHAPHLLLAMGVHKKSGFRIERVARGAPVGKPGRSDVDGDSLEAVEADAGDFESDLPLARFADELNSRLGVKAWVSEDAGGYVCERVYHRLLRRGAEQGVPALFVHVPPLEFTDLDEQEAVMRELFGLIRAELSHRARAGGDPLSS